jgi:hypothetical protein
MIILKNVGDKSVEEAGTIAIFVGKSTLACMYSAIYHSKTVDKIILKIVNNLI